MRVYLPLTLVDLADVQATGGLPAGWKAFAVTPTLREWYASGDTEELEYVALTDAAEESLRRLAADAGAPRRRVVLAADVPDAAVRLAGGDQPSAVEVTAPVARRDLASVHVDDPSAAADVAQAAEAIAKADAGDDDARFLVDGTTDLDLGWYGVQEISALLAPGA
ncbi:MAG: DUF6912 family protein [Sporichthyaceae bacterium]